MKPNRIALVRTTLWAGLLAGLTGCLIVKVNVNKPDSDHAGAKHGATSTQEVEESTGPEETALPHRVLGIIEPSGNAGSLNVPIGSLLTSSASTGCFRLANGWDRYFPVQGLFCGPNAAPCGFCFTNTSGAVFITVRTCNLTNGSTLKTGIVLANDSNPNDKKCVTNSPSCGSNPNLTTNQRSMASGNYYRATVFFKSSSLGGLTNVVVDWFYE